MSNLVTLIRPMLLTRVFPETTTVPFGFKASDTELLKRTIIIEITCHIRESIQWNEIE